MKIRTYVLILTIVGLWFYFRTAISLSFIALFALTFVTGWLYKVEAKLYYVLALVFLLFIPILISIDQLVTVEKIAKVAYLFLLLGLGWEYICYRLPAIKPTLITKTVKEMIRDLILFIVFIYNHILINIYNTLVKLKNYLHGYQLIANCVIHIKNSVLVTKWRQSLIVILSLIFIMYLYIKQYLFFKLFFIFDPFLAFIQDFFIYQLIIIIILAMFSFFLAKRYAFTSLFRLVVLSFYMIFLQVSSNTIAHYIKFRPYITRVMPTEASMWSHVTIYGNSFGDAQYNDAQVYIMNEPQRVLLWTDKKIVIVVDALRSPTGPLWMKNVDQKISNKHNFKYIPL